MRTTWKAYAQGNAALAITRLESKPAQAALAEIESARPPFTEVVMALQVAGTES